MAYSEQLENASFEIWVAGAPSYWTLGYNDTGDWTQETSIVKHGLSCVRLYACCYSALTYAQQTISAVPWRGKSITVKAWGRGYAYSNNDLTVHVDGTGGWTKHDTLLVDNTWEEKTITGTVPSDATYISISVRIYSGSYRSKYGYWDWVAITPVVTTDTAASDGTAATLNGTLDNDGGEACDCGFEYGETKAYGTITPTQKKNTGETFSQVITGLKPETTYHFRAIATNSAGISYGSDITFTTGKKYKGNPNIDQLIYQHVERIQR